jgi:hypothetical protein
MQMQSKMMAQSTHVAPTACTSRTQAPRVLPRSLLALPTQLTVHAASGKALSRALRTITAQVCPRVSLIVVTFMFACYALCLFACDTYVPPVMLFCLLACSA